ncbi:MAG TPA: two-component regulator propeller domain-containing protein, partial [Flavobacteriales bacterium]|nr:two-component regulator propeller domain-containing protein [Flavobacteriales bacterium]
MRTRLLHYFMISCVVLTSVQLTQAQVLNFEPLGVQDGVPANECYKIIQDKKGYIWLFTEFGIVKHNGERFVPVCTNVPFKEQNAYSIHVTEKNEIYFANSFCHIFLIRNDSALLIKPIAEFTKNFTMPDNIINTLIVDTNGDIYFSNFMKSYVYSNSTQRISTLEPDSTDNSRYYNLEYYKKISCHFFPIHHRKLAAPVNVTRLFIKDGPLSIDFNFTSPSLYENRQLQKIGNSYFFISPNTFFKIDAHENMTKINLEGILRYGYDGKKYLWILTTHGIYVFTKELKQVATYLEGYIVSDICFDNQQGIWVTTIGQGLFYCRSNEDFSYINTDIGTQEVIFVRRKENELYVSTAKDECYKIEGEKPVGFHTFKEPVFCQEITPYNGGHFFCAKKGVFYKKNGEIKEFFASPLIFKHIYSKGIFPLGKDSFLSYGGSDMALFTKNKFTKFIHVDHKVLCAIPYKSGLLIGTKEGLYIYDDANQLVKLFTTKLGKTSITSMVHDPHGNLWVGTHGEGLYIITKNNAVIKCKNCPFLVIKSIALTGTEIVVATNLGVYKNDYIGNHILHHWSTVYNTEVNGVEIMGERLWMATRNGLRSINLTKNRKNDHYPILLSSVFSNSKQVDVRKKSLQYNQNDLRFNIDFLDYYSKSKQFYFRLKGPSPLSGKINGNTLQIQNLSPGKYTLEIFPYHGHTFYKDHFARFPFSIQPAFWQTSWFKALAITSTISFSVLIGGLFFRNKRARERKISEVNSLLAEYKLTALKAQI